MDNPEREAEILALAGEISLKEHRIKQLKFESKIDDVKDNYLNKVFSYDNGMQFTYVFIEDYKIKGHLGEIILKGLMVTCNSLDNAKFGVKAGRASLIPDVRISYEHKKSLHKVFDFGITEFNRMVTQCLDNTNDVINRYKKIYNIKKLTDKL